MLGKGTDMSFTEYKPSGGTNGGCKRQVKNFGIKSSDNRAYVESEISCTGREVANEPEHF